VIAEFFHLRKSGPRWPVACRAAISIGLLVAIGWLSGHLSAGLMATLGAFTSLYASDRPYRNRAWVLAGIALSFAVVVSLGVGVQHLPDLAVPLLVVIAMIATFVCHAIRIGQPGAYMFALACAAGTSVPVAHRAFYEVGVLVLAGGVVSWIVHMTGAIFWPRGPERLAVTVASRAVAHFAEATGTEEKGAARHEAALSLHDAWAALVTYQPRDVHPDTALLHLLALNRELHLLFAACVDADRSSDIDSSILARRASDIGQQANSSADDYGRSEQADFPLGHLGSFELLVESLEWKSAASTVTLRVGIAVAAAGAIGATFGLERAYWAMAAAVLVLHQGLAWQRTLRRGVERTIGTLVGLGVAGAILAIHPAGLWLVLTMMSLQLFVEMLVTRNYALAVVFVTSIALLIASGGQRVAEPGALLLARGLDTTIGCGIGLLVYALFRPRDSSASTRQQIVLTLMAVEAVSRHIAAGRVTTDAAQQDRRDLQHRILGLVEWYEDEAGGLASHRAMANRMKPAVDAAQRLAYKVLAACWALQATQAERAIVTTREGVSSDEFVKLSAALENIIERLQHGESPVASPHVPGFVREEINVLSELPTFD
jgi:uncharacterized membrane protein YccC